MKAWMGSNFVKFETELLPLINIRIELLPNILKTNRLIKTKFCIHIIIDKIYFGIVQLDIMKPVAMLFICNLLPRFGIIFCP